MEPEVIRRFLESVGQKADVDLYLKLFRAQRKESFAIIVADAQIVRAALDPFHFDLRILAGLGLCPVVVVGLLDARDADRQSQRMLQWLLEDEVPSQIIGSGPDLPAEIRASVRETIEKNTIPIVSLDAAKELDIESRFRLLHGLAIGLQTRKVVFLSTSTGLEREGAPSISVVNLSNDYDRLLATGHLSRRHASLLRHVKNLLDQVPQPMSVAVVNPLQLLRELFTVNGAGTLIRRGSRIEIHEEWGRIDRERLRQLLHSAFGTSLVPGALDPGGMVEVDGERVYLEEGYLGAALIGNKPEAPYLSKFAIEREAQGEGISGEIWSLLTKDFPTFFWRARPSNPMSSWYAKQCDGMARFPEWNVFWRGLAADKIQPAIEYCLSAPRAFESD
jgi:hypothetical protein